MKEEILLKILLILNTILFPVQMISLQLSFKAIQKNKDKEKEKEKKEKEQNEK